MNEKCLFATLFTSIGAFVPGVPVQPVLIRYPNKLVSINPIEVLHYFMMPQFLVINLSDKHNGVSQKI